MTYQYMCGNEVIDVWYSTVVRGDVAGVYVGDKQYLRTIRTDEKGKFFTWNKHKIYLDNWIRTSMKELKQKIDNKEFITSDDLCVAILSDGVENVRFKVPINNGFEFKITECKIQESWNREVKNKYKLVFVPVESGNAITGKREFYVCDLVSCIEDGSVQIIV